ncbi:MAG TPA: toprim domain-containing protein [Candidatus Nanoarchaeia archaeon]|nr:toprim domain-containing protein [Candidatus Nanoarchaeia archaeon]
MDDLQEWLFSLVDSGKLVIVEGKRDVAALHDVGVCNILALNTEPVFSFVEKLTVKDVVILTDVDPAGKKLYAALKKACVHNGIKVDNIFREFLLRETTLVHIEGLATYFRKRL